MERTFFKKRALVVVVFLLSFIFGFTFVSFMGRSDVRAAGTVEVGVSWGDIDMGAVWFTTQGFTPGDVITVRIDVAPCDLTPSCSDPNVTSIYLDDNQGEIVATVNITSQYNCYYHVDFNGTGDFTNMRATLSSVEVVTAAPTTPPPPPPPTNGPAPGPGPAPTAPTTPTTPTG